jgi:hypothetical protein
VMSGEAPITAIERGESSADKSGMC